MLHKFFRRCFKNFSMKKEASKAAAPKVEPKKEESKKK